MWLHTVVAWSAQTKNPYSSLNEFEGVEERHESWFCRSKSPNDGLRLLQEYSEAFRLGESNTASPGPRPSVLPLNEVRKSGRRQRLRTALSRLMRPRPYPRGPAKWMRSNGTRRI